MAYPYVLHRWLAETTFEVGDVVRASPPKGNTLAFKCIVTGTTASADEYATFASQEPAFPFKITQTLVDGTCTWEAFEPLAEELLKLDPTAIIDLFEVELTLAVNGVNDTLRYHPGKNGLTEDLKFDSQTYAAVPVEIDGFEFSAKGTLPRPTMRVANVNNAITNLILQYDPLAAKVRRIRTFAKFIDTTNFSQGSSFAPDQDVTDVLVTEGSDSFIMETFNDTSDPDAKIVETWYIDRVSSENQQFVEFELAPKLDLTNVPLPGRTIEEFCPWRYRGAECGYTGDSCFTVNDVAIPQSDKVIVDGTVTNDICGKRVSSCQARFGQNAELPFGGFYGARLQA